MKTPVALVGMTDASDTSAALPATPVQDIPVLPTDDSYLKPESTHAAAADTVEAAAPDDSQEKAVETEKEEEANVKHFTLAMEVEVCND